MDIDKKCEDTDINIIKNEIELFLRIKPSYLFSKINISIWKVQIFA